MKKRTRRSKTSRSTKQAVVLDAFTQQQLHSWASQGDTLQRLSRSAPSIAVDVTNWARVTDWRWNLTPLSAAGSLNGIGGRFNIGNDLDRARNQAFMCLYLAENVDTAFAEYFGGSLSSTTTGLSLSEFALRRASSFTTFLLRGQLYFPWWECAASKAYISQPL
jgi:hypothetical protein